MPPYLFVASYVPASIRTLEPMGMPASTRQIGSPSVIFVWSFSVCYMHGIRSSVKHSEKPAKAGIIIPPRLLYGAAGQG